MADRFTPEEIIALLERAQAVAHIGSWVAELDGSDRMIWSAETHRIFGVTAGQFDGNLESFFALVHPDDLAAVKAATAAAVNNRTPYTIDHRVVCPDGSLRWVHERGDVLVDAAGTPLRIVGTTQEIAERRQLEDELRQSQKTQTLGRLAGGIAHDLNNALTAISGYAELALAAVSDPHPARPDIDEIRKAAARAAAVMKQLLTFSRRGLLEPRVFDLNPAVSGIGRMLGHLLGGNIQLSTDLAVDLPPIYGDPGQVEQAIVNLAVNARDAMEGGGALALETSVSQVDDAFVAAHQVPMAPGPYVVLQVRDTGHGMSRDTQSRIFEPFFTTKEAGKGTGLGLSMVYGTVKQSGGFIFVDSEIGRGTTFALYFPVAPRPAETTAPSPAVEAYEPSGGHETLLIVEDEPAVRNLVSSSLRGQGYRLLVASSGAEAMRIAAAYAGSIDLLLTDAMMPGQSGIDLAHELSALRPGLRVIVMSGYTSDLLGLGSSPRQITMLQKPFTPQELRLQIVQALASKKPSII